MLQLIVTPAAGKHLIAKALAAHPTVLNTAKNGTLVIVAGTTNGYVAEEVMKTLNITGFSRQRFFRGIIVPPNKPITAEGRLQDESKFPGDVVISKNVWLKNKTITDVADSLKQGDVIIKGANAVDLERKEAAILIGHPKAGTIGISLPAVLGRRVKLIIAVGLEKRVIGNLHALAEKASSPEGEGYRLLVVPGQVFTEIDALNFLSGGNVELLSAGGVCGAEGSIMLLVTGTKEQEKAAKKVYTEVANEPAFDFS